MLFGLFNHFLNKKIDITNREVDIIEGGIKDETNHFAPKSIKSSELKSFETSFYRFSDYYYDNSRDYHFKMEINEDGLINGMDAKYLPEDVQEP